MAIAPSVTPITTYPDPNNPDTREFNNEAYAFTSETLPNMVAQINALVAWLNEYVVSVVIKTIATEEYTFLADDAAKYCRFTFDGAKDISVPEGLPANWAVRIRNANDGDLTLVEVGAVVITPPAGGTLVIPPNGSAFLVRVAANTYDLVGQVVAE